MRTFMLGVAMMLGANAMADSADLTAVRADWNTPAQPFRAIGNIYYVGTHELASWLIATPGGGILIEKNLNTLGFSVKDIKILLNTHAHFDHSGGLARIKRDSGAILWASLGDRKSLEGGRYLGSDGNQELDSPPVSVDRIVADYRSTFGKLKSMQVDVFLSIHQGFFGLWEKRAAQKAGAPNPFVDPSEFQAFVSGSHSDFEADLSKQINKGKT